VHKGQQKVGLLCESIGYVTQRFNIGWTDR